MSDLHDIESWIKDKQNDKNQIVRKLLNKPDKLEIKINEGLTLVTIINNYGINTIIFTQKYKNYFNKLAEVWGESNRPIVQGTIIKFKNEIHFLSFIKELDKDFDCYLWEKVND